jgi:hypothetical protein
MSTRKPGDKMQQKGKTRSVTLKDLAPRAGAAQKVKGGPTCPHCRNGAKLAR